MRQLLVFLMLVCLCGCGSSGSPQTAAAEPQQSAAVPQGPASLPPANTTAKESSVTVKIINWEVLFPLLITTFVAIVGWYVAHHQSVIRDRKNKQRDVQVQYLIEAYRRLESAGSRSAREMDRYGHDFESAIADIQLFGTVDQARMAKDLVTAIAEKRPDASTGPLLLSLRDDLRRELNLDHVKEEPVHFRVKKN